jgi:hypothetical protein
MLLLVEQLAEDLGSQAKAEAYLGMSKGYVSKLKNETHRGVGVKFMLAARRKLRLHDGWFTNPALGSRPHYRDHSGSEPRLVAEDPAGWSQLVAEGYIDYARSKGLAEEQIEHVRTTPEGRGGLTADDYRRLLDEAITRALRPSRAGRGAELSQWALLSCTRWRICCCAFIGSGTMSVTLGLWPRR